ncbi:MAG: TonB-dependent receptor plug domain-containing protein [Bacteroidales bacterium]
MRIIVILMLALLSAPDINAQLIRVIDAEDSRPVKDVAVFNNQKSRFGYTSLAGEFRITAFGRNETVNFQHPSYNNVSLTVKEMEDRSWVVLLFPKTFEIDEFVVSANRWEQDKDEIPNKITQIRRPQIEFSNPQTAADLMGSTGEVFVQKSQMGGGSPMIRGFATNRVLIVVDGVRMNNAIFREGNVQNIISLDPNIIESAEVIFGPGAVIYGSDAIGGGMDFHTRKPLLSTGEKPNLRVNAMTRYSSANNEQTGHVDFNIGGSRISSLTSITLSDFGDMIMGSKKHPEYRRPEYVTRIGNRDTVVTNRNPNKQVESGYSSYYIMQKIRFQPTEKLDIVLATHISRTSDIPRYDRLIQYRNNELRYGDWYYGPQKWTMNSASVEWKPGNRFFDAARLNVTRQDFSESRYDRQFGDTELNSGEEKVVAYSVNADFEKEWNRKLLYWGIEGVTNDVTSTARSEDIITGEITPQASRYPDGENRYTGMGLYTGIKISLSEKIFLNGGARYNYNSLHSTFIDNSFYNFPFTEIDNSNGALTGSVGFVLITNENGQLSINGSSGYRAPNLDDAGKVFDSEPGSVVVPNPSLNPERAYNIDLGITRDLFDLIHIELTAFHTWLDNAMVRRNFTFDGQDSILYRGELSRVLAIVNAGSATVSGGHLSMQISPNRYLKVKSNINITRGEDQDGIPLRHVSPLFGSAHVIFENKKIKADLYGIYNGEISYDNMPPSEAGKKYLYAIDENEKPYCPAWYTINLMTSYQVGNFGIINAGIENLLDHRYRPYSSGIVSPGRNFIVSLRIKI